jgi:hypothetical protein
MTIRGAMANEGTMANEGAITNEGAMTNGGAMADEGAMIDGGMRDGRTIGKRGERAKGIRNDKEERLMSCGREEAPSAIMRQTT